MRLNLLFILFAFSIFGFSQEERNSIYFPQEQLIHPDCTNSEDKNSCLKNIFNSQIQDILQQYVNEIKLEKDTINVNIRFDINQKGIIGKGYQYVTVSEEKLDERAGEELDLIFSTMPEMEVLNKKPEEYNSFHLLHLSYIANTIDGNTALAAIDSKSKYSGGSIEEMPVFPGCEGLPNKDRNLCFNKGMQKHLAENFRYPKKAQKKKIQGRVNIMFWIDETGNVSNIKTRGPNPILEEEAIRIIRLFPKCIPGTLNGEPKRIPYAVPITFKLS